MEIVNLKKEDYDELHSLLNYVFGIKNNKTMDFKKELPKMCKRDDEHMGKYVAIKEDGKICASVGIYPFKTKIMGQEFTFSTVGNVVTHPQYEGRGYMKHLLPGRAFHILLSILMERLQGISVFHRIKP